jgi:hypothetical protein
MTDADRLLLHICYASTDRGWVHGRVVVLIAVDETDVYLLCVLTLGAAAGYYWYWYTGTPWGPRVSACS